MKLIPEEMTLELSQQVEEEDVWKVEELMTFLQKEVESRARTVNMTKSAKERMPKEREKETCAAWEMRTKQHNTMTASVLYTSNPGKKSRACAERKIKSDLIERIHAGVMRLSIE